MSASYGAGKRLGAELKKVSVNKETNDGDEKTVNKMFNNKGKGKKFGANKQEDIKEEDDEDEDYKDSNQSSDSDESESKKSSNSSSDSSIKIKRKGKKSKNKKKSSSSSAEMGKSISSSSSKKSSKKIKSSSSNKSSNTIKSKSKSKEGSNGLKGPTLLPSAMFNSNSSPPREARRRASGYPDLQKEPEEIETKFQPSKDEPFAPKPRDSLSSMKPPLRKNLLLPPSTNY